MDGLGAAILVGLLIGLILICGIALMSVFAGAFPIFALAGLGIVGVAAFALLYMAFNRN